MVGASGAVWEETSGVCLELPFLLRLATTALLQRANDNDGVSGAGGVQGLHCVVG